MTLTDFATVSTAISGVAVTISLIYLAVQTHQNTRNTRALIHQGSAARTVDILTSLMNPEYCAAWIEGNDGKATPETIRARQFFFHCSIAINAMEDQYLQHKSGLVSGEQFGRVSETFRGLLSEPGMRRFWNADRARIVGAAPGFCAYVDSLCTAEAAAFANRV